MPRVAVVTDSTSDLPPAVRDRLGMTVVPLNVQFGSEVYRDGIDIGIDEFLARLATAPEPPTTAQPAPGVFAETFRHLAADHDAIVAVHLSGKLSGTVRSAELAKSEVADIIPVHVVDSQNATMGLGLQAMRAAELAAAGHDAAAIAHRLRAETGRYHVAFFVDTLEYLRRGGRIGRAAALLGSVLSLKPLLRIDEGQIVPLERTRTRERAIRGLVAFARSLPRLERLAVLHSSTQDLAAALAEELAPLTPGQEALVGRFGPVIATHVGPGALGVALAEGGTA